MKRSINKKIFILGYYGFGNSGDEQILKYLLLDLNSNNTYVLSNNPKETSFKHEVQSIYRYSLLKILFSMKKGDALILGGGSVLQDKTSTKSFLYYILICIIALLKKTKLIFYGNGIEKLKCSYNKKILKFVFDRASLITLRDEESFNNIKELNVSNDKVFVTADLVFNYSNDKKLIRKRKKTLGISLRDSNILTNDKILVLADLISLLKEKFDYEIVFICMQTPNDYVIINKINSMLNIESEIVCSDDLEVYQQFDFVIGMRLHSLIYSTIFNIPFFALSYDEKVENYLSYIDYKYFLRLNEMNREELFELVNELIDNYGNIKKKLNKEYDCLHKKVRDNKEYLNSELMDF